MPAVAASQQFDHGVVNKYLTPLDGPRTGGWAARPHPHPLLKSPAKKPAAYGALLPPPPGACRQRSAQTHRPHRVRAGHASHHRTARSSSPQTTCARHHSSSRRRLNFSLMAGFHHRPGKPAHVLLSFSDSRSLTKQRRNIADALAMQGIADIEFEPPRVTIQSRPADFS